MTSRKNRAGRVIDIGITTMAPEPMIAFYRDVLELIPVGQLPTLSGSRVEQLAWGSSIVKIVTLSNPGPPRVPGNIDAATGYRYLTLQVEDLPHVVERCSTAGAPVVLPATLIPDGSTIAIVADPDGNWVEIMQERVKRS